MPRRPRFVCEGQPHHVTQRGNYRQNILERAEDFRKYSYLVAEYSVKYEISILAYCLMNNHVHFIVTPKTKEDLSRFFNVVHMRYSQYKNSLNKKIGHLWQGRFFSSVLDDSYLLSAIRYVEQNPVRAGMVEKPWDYIWSSAREHVKLEKSPIIPTASTNHILKMWDKKTWIDFLTEENQSCNDRIRQETMKCGVLGSEDFIDALELRTGIVLKASPIGRPRK